MKDSDSISKKSSSDSENLVNKIVAEMPKDKRTKAYKEWVKKYGQKASDSNEIPEMPKDKRTKAYKEWVKQYGGQEVTSDKSEKKPSWVSESLILPPPFWYQLFFLLYLFYFFS